LECGGEASDLATASGKRIQEEAPMLSVSSIAHVAIRVKDIGPTLDFYVGKLGMREMMRLDRDGRLWLLYLRITDTQFLEVFPEGEGDRAAAREAVGYNHMCLEVADIDIAVRELAAAGVPLIRDKQLGADGNWQAWIEDPDGHRIELMQMMPDSLQARALARMAAAG
jgi:lactoylglutathione lyase